MRRAKTIFASGFAAIVLTAASVLLPAQAEAPGKGARQLTEVPVAFLVRDGVRGIN